MRRQLFLPIKEASWKIIGNSSFDEILHQSLPSIDNYLNDKVFEVTQQLQEKILFEIASIRASESAESDGVYGGIAKVAEKKLVKKKQPVLQQQD